MKSLLAALAALACIGAAGAANATIVLTYGQTSRLNTITATTNAADTATTIHANNVAVQVTQDIAGVLGSAFLDLTATSIDAATPVGTGALQHYSGTFSITALPSGGGANFLSGSFTDALFGTGSALTLSVGSPPDTLALSSSVIPAGDLDTPKALAFGLSNITPALHIIGSTIGGFSGGISGTFSATPRAVVEPSSLLLFGVGLLSLGIVLRKRYV